jgi:hypothetical protein
MTLNLDEVLKRAEEFQRRGTPSVSFTPEVAIALVRMARDVRPETMPPCIHRLHDMCWTHCEQRFIQVSQVELLQLCEYALACASVKTNGEER